MRVLALDAATEACSAALLVDGACIERYVESPKGHAAGILDMARQVLAEGQCTLRMLDGLAASVGPGSFTGVRITVAVAQGLAFGAGLACVPVSTLEALSFGVIGAPVDARGDNAPAAAPGARGDDAPGARRDNASGARDDNAPAGALGDWVLACLDARMGEVYWGWYGFDRRRGVQSLAPPEVSAPEAVQVNLASGLGGGVRATGVGRGFRAFPALAATLGLSVSATAAAALPRADQMARLGSLRLAAGEGADATLLEPQYLRNKVALTELERAAAKAVAP